MAGSSFKTFLTSVIAEALQPQSVANSPQSYSRAATPQPQPLLPQAAKVADELIAQAIASGLPLTHLHLENRQLGGGNTAEVVAHITMHVPFAFKLDNASSKLAAEGAMMRKVRNDPRLPRRFRDAWPVIYAVREAPPYAYLMEFFPPEDGWNSLEERLFPKDGVPISFSEATRLIHHVLDILFAGFDASVEPRSRPNLQVDYISRIRERLASTAAIDGRFSSRELLVNEQRLQPWQQYLDSMARHAQFIDVITPQFTTVTHGDPNPGNLMLRTTSAEVELKLIDPKEWFSGDYLFDIAKITHFLQSTGPIEKPADGTPVEARFDASGAVAVLNYSFHHSTWTEAVVAACLDRVERFASTHGDAQWRARYELGMAANLLGLPLGRLTNKKSPRAHAALALYGEGLKWLARFCDRLPQRTAVPAAVVGADVAEIEPAPLRLARNTVRENVNDWSEGLDRRGFQLLTWQPQRANDSNKPAELSLEHEARLKPRTELGLQRLLTDLQSSQGLQVTARLLPGNTSFDSLRVNRYERDTGAQSIDRYYDIPSSKPEQQLAYRMITLRQRVATSKFMTWSTNHPGMRPLNLELPFVALGSGVITARVEFNWIDDIQVALADATAALSSAGECWSNPIFIAAKLYDVELAGAKPVIEHTTYREKFAVNQRGSNGQPDTPLFDINIDHVVAQSLLTHRVGTYVDVDISPHQRVNAVVLGQVTEFAAALAVRYDLEPSWSTKALRDMVVTASVEERSTDT